MLSYKNGFSLLILCSIFFFSFQALAFDAGVVPATRKVMPEMEMPADTSITIKGGRNEFESFQIVIRDAADLSGINVEVSDLTNANNSVLAKENAKLYREYYLNVTNASSVSLSAHPRETGYYPDPLIPFTDKYSEGNPPLGAPFEIKQGETGVVYVDWHIPLDQQPGNYRGTATVTANGSSPVQIEINLTVWDFEIPQTKSMGSTYGFSEDYIKDYHCGVPTDEECEKEMKIRYLEAMHQHRMDRTRIKGPVDFNFDDDGNLLPTDWTAYDAYMEPYLSGSMFEDGIGITRFDVKHFKPGSGTGSMTDDQFAQAAAAFAEHLELKGWWDNAFSYASDEPWLKDEEESNLEIKHDAQLQGRYSDLWEDKVLVTGPYVEELHDEVGIWCPVTPMYDSWFWLDGKYAGRETYPDLLAEGKELWFYVCNASSPPYAGYDIDSTIGYEPRIVKWSSWFEGASGFLYWRVNYWPLKDPWTVFLNVENFGEIASRNGDGILLYPGNHDGLEVGVGSPEGLAYNGPIVSYRMKQIRDGFEDWELFILAENLGAKDYVKEQIALVYTQFGNFPIESCDMQGAYCPDNEPWTLDENLLLEVRDNIAAKVQFLLHPDKYNDPEADEPADGDADLEEDGDLDNELDSELENETELEAEEDSETANEDEAEVDGDKTDTEDDGSSCNSTKSNVSWLVALLMLFVLRRKIKQWNRADN